MSANNLATRLHNYFSTSEMGPVPMSVIIAQFRDDPELDGMDTSRASRKLRRVLSGLDDIVKIGDKRGAAYVFDPTKAHEKSMGSHIEETILLHHLFNGGRYTTDNLIEKLNQDFPKKDAVNKGLNNLLQARALKLEPPETVLDSGFWNYSGLLPRGTTSFSHTGTARRSMEQLEELLSIYGKEGKSLPGTFIPAPTNPSRSMAIETALVFTVTCLKSHLNEFLQSKS